MTKIVCVYTKEIEESYQSAIRCVKSCERFGYKVNLRPSVYWKNVEEEAAKDGLKLRYKPIKEDKFTGEGVAATRMANGLTHYRLYRQIVKTDEPMVILEHDAEIVGKLPEPIEDGVIQISSHTTHQLSRDTIFQCNRARKMIDRDEPFRANFEVGVNRHPLNGTNGTSGYIISPGAAKKMMEVVEEGGVGFGDRVRTEYIGEGNLYLQVPQSVLCYHNRIKTAKKMRLE